MTAKTKRNPMISLGVTTAMAAVLLSGCAGNGAPRAEISAADAQQAMAQGHTSEAVQHAEAAVLAEPRNAGYRMMLGNAYLNEGRFASASTTFADAMALGENSPRAALSYALSLTGEGRFAEASAVLADWEGEIAAGDLGLAYALAGQPERGIHLLTNAIRQGDDTVKTRQNLAYAYAVAGRWREARLMVSQDVPADQVGGRMQQWAQLTQAEAYQHRVAGLLNVPAGVRDAGQPMQLALANHPGMEQLAAEASGYAAVQEEFAVAEMPASAPSMAELPAVSAPEIGLDTYGEPAGTPPTSFDEAFATVAPSGQTLAGVTTDTMRFVSEPVVQTTPVRQGATGETRAPSPRPVARREVASAAPAATPAASGPVVDGSHLVQLGSFSSEQGARRAWGIYVSRHPSLANHEMVITEAVVRGRRYWRVSAGGFDVASSRSMCSSVNNSAAGEGCISWAANSPLPGAVDRGGTMFARR